MNDKSLCSELRAKRERLKMPISEVEKVLHVCASTISYWERGRDIYSCPNFGELYGQFLQDCEEGKITYRKSLRTGKINPHLLAKHPGHTESQLNIPLVTHNNDDYETKAEFQRSERIKHPKHYNTGSIEAIDFIEAYGLNFNLGNVIKYISRAGHKDGEETLTALKKAQWYLEREINRFNPNGQVQS